MENKDVKYTELGKTYVENWHTERKKKIKNKTTSYTPKLPISRRTVTSFSRFRLIMQILKPLAAN